MAYDPHIQDIRGQLYANGIASAGDLLAKGIQQFVQNQQITKSQVGKFNAFLSANPDVKAALAGATDPSGATSLTGAPAGPNGQTAPTPPPMLARNPSAASAPTAPQPAQAPTQLPLSPDVIKAFANLQSGKVGLQDAAVLGAFADTTGQIKQQQSEASLRAAQAQAAQAVAVNATNEAKIRDLQFQQQQKFLDRMDAMLEGSNGPTPASQDVANRDPDFAPATPPPTWKDAAKQILDSGLATSREDVLKSTPDVYTKMYETWKNGTRIQGVVPGSDGFDAKGQPTKDYYTVVVKNDGSIERAKEPIKVYANQPPPGQLLDAQTYKPLKTVPNVIRAPGAPQQPGQPPAQIPAQPAVSPAALDDIGTAQQNIRTAMLGLQSIDRMSQLNDAMKQKRWGGFSGLTGTNWMNNMVEPAMGDNTGQAFDAESAKFKADVMSSAKNVRNVYEFRAITGNVPEANQTPETRSSLLATKRDILQQDLAVNQTALKLMQQGVVPDTAWVQAANLVYGKKPEMEKVGTAPTIQAAPAQAPAQSASAPRIRRYNPATGKLE